eukprot:7383611-Alexandrium_andersonii.AAC.1
MGCRQQQRACRVNSAGVGNARDGARGARTPQHATCVCAIALVLFCDARHPGRRHHSRRVSGWPELAMD